MTPPLGRLFGQREAPLAAHLPYWEIRNGLVFLYSGQCEVGLELRLPATTLHGDDERLRLHAALMTVLRHAVPEGERLRLYVEVAPLRRQLLDAYEHGLTSAHPAARLFSQDKAHFLEESRRRGELVEYRAYLSCTLRQPGRGKARKRTRPDRSLTPTEFASWARRALALRNRLLELLGQAGYAPTPLLDGGLFELLYRYFNPGGRTGPLPGYQPTGLHLPHSYLKHGPHRAAPTLRTRLSSSDIGRHHWHRLRIGHHQLATVTLGSLPTGASHIDMAGRLLGLPGLYWLIADYRHEPQGLTLRALEGRARRFSAAQEDSGGFSSYVDAGVRAGAGETDEAVLHITQTGCHLFQLGLSVILCDPDEEGLHRSVETAASRFAQLPGVTPVVETAALAEQFLALAPFSGRSNERMQLVLEENAADFVPLNGPWRGTERPVALLLNRWNSLTALDPFDARANNWNGLVVGGSGSGKTFFVQSLLSELLRQETDIIIVDRGYGYAPLVELYGGATVPLDASGSVALNPFDLPPGQTEPDDEKQAFLMALLRAMIPGEGGTIEAVENALLTAAISQTYARARSERRSAGQLRTTFEGARLSDLVRVLVTLEEVGERPASPQEKELARGLALRLQAWTGDTPFGRLLDRETSVLPDAPIIYFETSKLEGYPELQNVATLLIAAEVWRRVKRQRERRKMVVLDEFWALLQIPQAAAFIVELYRRFRRYNAAVYAVTQSLKDFMGEAAQGILQNTSYHFLLPLPGEDGAVQELLNLSDAAMAQYRGLAATESYRELLGWVRRDGQLEGDVLRVVPRPLAYWAFTTNADDMAERELEVAAHGGRLLPALLSLAKRYPNGVRGLVPTPRNIQASRDA